ncbi:hypothetical protein Baya_5769 [Bagarius yarrelli]|uniref:TGFBR3/Endoglin-like N-terminal domain-containing protein n=1 Tax=Bagarius yarrelli TaxID=175774 RepID=A0A556TYF3_BAGYA|nr:hypothetical protein Baya_5769 [Bagarius yarrelli]
MERKKREAGDVESGPGCKTSTPNLKNNERDATGYTSAANRTLNLTDFSHCNLTGIYGTQNEFVSVDEIMDECKTNFVTENGTEVHVVNLRISSEVTKKTPLKAFGCQVHSAPAVQGSELVSWATEQFGGVSSFITLRDPQMIHFSELKGSVTSLSSDCHIRPNLQTEAEAVQSCLLGSNDELHVINIPDHVIVRNVTVNVTTSNIKVVLRGPSGTVWNSNAGKLLSNNVVHLNGMTVNPRFVLSDSDTELWTQTLSYFKDASISSYTKIHLNSPEIKIRIRARESTEVVTEKAETKESPTSHISMQLFLFPDYTAELHPSTKVLTNKRIYAQVSSLVHGELELIISVRSCLVRSKSLQPVERTLSVKSEPCSTCRNNNRFSFSLDTLQDLPSNIWELWCNISHCSKQPKQGCSEPQLVVKSVQVTPFVSPQTYEGRDLKGGEGDLNKPRDDLPLEIR